MLIFSTKTTASYEKIPIFLYISEGLLVLLVNMFLAVRLFSSHNLRSQKEFVVIGSCIIFDVFFGLTYFSAGVYRLIIIIKYEYFPLVSMFDCFLTIHNQLFIVITVMAGIQLLSTAIDRFICVFCPFFYIKLQIEYSYCIMFLPYLVLIPLWIPGAMGSYENGDVKNFTINCLLNQSIPVNWYVYYRTIRIICTILCIIIYIPIFIKMYLNHAKISKNSKRLLDMTKTVAMITGSTFILFTIPDLITYFYPFVNSNVMYLMNLNKGVVNILIFMLTTKTLRHLMFPSSPREVTSERFSVKKVKMANVVYTI